jgi:hypothetical protein
MEALLKKPDILRDENGRFDRHGKMLAKTSKKTKPNKILADNRDENGHLKKGHSGLPGAGRPPGSLNRTTVQLKQAILDAAEAAGGDEGMVGYLSRLAVENSSAFASLLKSVLPTTLTAESDGGQPVHLQFTRILVWPDGHKEIEGVTPKQLPAPDVTERHIEPFPQGDPRNAND